MKIPFSECIHAFLFLVAAHLHAQTPNCSWSHRAGGVEYDRGDCVATDASGNVYVTGTFFSPTITFGAFTLTNADNSGLSGDMYLVKYNSSGTVLWANRIGGLSSEDGVAVATDASGNCYVTGNYSTNSILIGATLLTNSGATEIFIVKYNSAGSVIWAQSAGGNYSEQCRSLAVDSSGSCYITGKTASLTCSFGSVTINSSGSSFDPFLVKYNSAGTALWAKIGNGPGNDESYDVATDPTGGVCITGSFQDTINFGGNFLASFDTTGALWAIFLMKFDDSGTPVWAKSANGTNSAFSYSVAVDFSGNSYITGYFSGLTITFGSYTLNNNGGTNVFLVKFDASGNISWAQRAGGWSTQQGNSLSVDISGNVYLAGTFTGTSITFGFVTLINTNSQLEMFFTKYNSSGNVLWAKSGGGSSGDVVYAVAIDSWGNSYWVGLFNSTSVTFCTNTLINADASSSTYDMFILKLDNSGTVVAGTNPHDHTASLITLFPNPSSGTFYVELNDNDSARLIIEINDVLGNVIFKSELTSSSLRIGLPETSSGIYLYKIFTPDEIIQTGKLIVE